MGINMKKFLTIVAMFISCGCFAKGSSYTQSSVADKMIDISTYNSLAKGSSYTQSSIEDRTTGIIPYNSSNRIKMFDSSRNSFTIDGEIVVCLPQFEADWRNGSCLDRKKQNAWYKIEDSSPPNYQVTFIEYRFMGNGSRILIVHYAPK